MREGLLQFIMKRKTGAYSKQEVKYIIEHMDTTSAYQIAQHLNRWPASINLKIKRLRSKLNKPIILRCAVCNKILAGQEYETEYRPTGQKKKWMEWYLCKACHSELSQPIKLVRMSFVRPGIASSGASKSSSQR